MHKYAIAREAKLLREQLDFMKSLEGEAVDVYLEDVRARIARMGFDLEDVVAAGLHRLGRVSSSTIAIVEREPDFPSLVTDRNWREEALRAIHFRSEYIRWADSTFLRCRLAMPEISSRDMQRVDAIIAYAYEQEGRSLMEAQYPATAPADQFPLDV